MKAIVFLSIILFLSILLGAFSASIRFEGMSDSRLTSQGTGTAKGKIAGER
jgi:hypothetical protein